MIKPVYDLMWYLESIVLALLMFSFLNSMFILRRPGKAANAIKLLLCILVVRYINSYNDPTLNLCGGLVIQTLWAVWLFRLSLGHAILYVSFYIILMVNVEMAVVFLFPFFGVESGRASLLAIVFMAAEILGKIFLVAVVKRQVKGVDYERNHSYMGFLSLFSAAIFILLMSGIYPETEAGRGNLFMVLSGVFFIFANVAGFTMEEKMMETARNQQSHLLAERSTQLEQLHYKRMEDITREYGAYVHELEHSLRTIRQLKKEGREAEADRETAAAEDLGRKFKRKLYITDPIVNAILMDLEGTCREHGLRYDVMAAAGLDLEFIEDVHKISMFGNLLENAAEAAARAEGGFVQVDIYMGNKALLVFKVENNFRVAPNKKNGCYLTTKQDKKGHGFGIKKVRELAGRYNGLLDLQQENGIFTASLILSTVPKSVN